MSSPVGRSLRTAAAAAGIAAISVGIAGNALAATVTADPEADTVQASATDTSPAESPKTDAPQADASDVSEADAPEADGPDFGTPEASAAEFGTPEADASEAGAQEAPAAPSNLVGGMLPPITIAQQAQSNDMTALPEPFFFSAPTLNTAAPSSD